MIRGYVTACNTGIVTQLPEPLEWELVRADKAERDSFFFTFLLLNDFKYGFIV